MVKKKNAAVIRFFTKLKLLTWHDCNWSILIMWQRKFTEMFKKRQQNIEISGNNDCLAYTWEYKTLYFSVYV